MKTLNEIGLQYNTDKSSASHNYLNTYENYFSNIRLESNNILEIGILFGDSLKVFCEYFENSKIYAIDIEDKTHLQNEKIKIFRADQSDRNFLNGFQDNFFNIIIDDGSHKMQHQQISIAVLFKKLKSNGIYIVEDLHTSLPDYIETINYGKSLFGLNEDNSNSTIDFLNGLLQESGTNHYLTKNEYDYLKNNIDFLKIIQTSHDIPSITSIIKKL